MDILYAGFFSRRDVIFGEGKTYAIKQHYLVGSYNH